VTAEFTRADLDYELPPERIAQQPVRPRDHSRLLIVGRDGGALEERRFDQLAEELCPDDLLVVNDTRVVPAKLRGRKSSGGVVEALLVERRPDGAWLAYLKASGRLRTGLRLEFEGANALTEDVLPDGRCLLRFELAAEGSEEELLDDIGEMPLPPYIRREDPRPEDLEDYQTVFAEHAGAIAAPTASLHFTTRMAARLRIARVTLHVGPGTFLPIRSERVEDHVLEAERFEVPEETARSIAETRRRGGRVIAVGTTVVRTLETTKGDAGSGRTGLFILPGHEFRAVDSLITNFHLPGSSLLALVMAFAGVECTRSAYRHAVEQGFRFYSYGDAMWIR